MQDLRKMQNPYNSDKVIDACSIFGMMDISGRRFSGADIIKAIGNMHVRGNGLGGGFAVYGLYPDYAEYYALHVMYLSSEGKTETEAYLKDKFHLIDADEIKTRPLAVIEDPPLVWRYFLKVNKYQAGIQSDDDFVVDRVMDINIKIKDSFVFSSGKNMGVFKGVGYPEEIGQYFRLEEYEGYLWTSHGRYPTNSRGWWGGAHPFNILDWTVVHNGELSSYGINRRYLEQYGYICTMETDTEVIAYAIDLLVRKHGLPLDVVSRVFAAPFWDDIDRMPASEQEMLRALRQVYSSLLLNGPFTLIIAHEGEMIGLTDRIRLRPLTAATKGKVLFLSSEEAAIRTISPQLDSVWIPDGGEAIVASLKSPFESPTSISAVADYKRTA
ncbi:MAG: glutamine amidotransferase family protein [Chloroflexi bacterium]|jgi:glutamate synthase domain-containing protein 1|nr:glutamine amidotransferase family protein [Chloroflexota bacterium]